MPANLLADFPRGDPDRMPPPIDVSAFRPPESRFAHPAAVKAAAPLQWQAGKLFLGLIDGVEKIKKGEKVLTGGVEIGIHDNRHIITFAGSRAGKGRSAIVPNMLHYPGSVLATDPKGELAAMTARRRVELGQAVHVLDPFGASGARNYPARHGLIKGFNPIAAMRDESLIEDAALISDALVVVGGKDPHWDESARTFIEGVVLHLRTWPAYDGVRNLLTLRDLVGRGAVDNTPDGKKGGGFSMKALEYDMRKNPAAERVIQAAASDFFDRPEREQGSVLSTARRQLKFIDLFKQAPFGKLTLEQNDFRLSELKTKATTLYLCLPARHVGTCNRWLRLFVNLTMQEMERTPEPDSGMPGGVPVLCVLDEFATLGYLKQIEDAAGIIAGFGIKLWPVLQDMGQLKALYEERWETSLGNAGIIQFFGNNDLTTLEWVSKRLGKTSIVAPRTSDRTVGQRMDGATGISEATEVYDLLAPDEIARFFGRHDPLFRQLVILAGYKNPFLVLQRAYYDAHGRFAGLFDVPA